MWGIHLKSNEAAYQSNNSVIFGQYNDFTWVENQKRRLLSVGNGASDSERKNAFEVLLDGRAKVYGVPSEANDVVRLYDLEHYPGFADQLNYVDDADIDALWA